MSAPHERLIAHWKGQGLGIAQGASDESIRAFELKWAVKLPSDLAQYFRHVDGMRQDWFHGQDSHGFSFWSIGHVQDVLTVCERYSLSPPEEHEGYFVFADYLQWSWGYAIRIRAGDEVAGPVIHVGTGRPKTVAVTFEAFVDAYVDDATTLYPDE